VSAGAPAGPPVAAGVGAAAPGLPGFVVPVVVVAPSPLGVMPGPAPGAVPGVPPAAAAAWAAFAAAVNWSMLA
jgi:hypothetical protein